MSPITAQLLKDIREAAFDHNVCGFSTGEMAKASGLSYGTIWRLKRRKMLRPSNDTIIAMARAVKMDATILAELLVKNGFSSRKITRRSYRVIG